MQMYLCIYLHVYIYMYICIYLYTHIVSLHSESIIQNETTMIRFGVYWIYIYIYLSMLYTDLDINDDLPLLPNGNMKAIQY